METLGMGMVVLIQGGIYVLSALSFIGTGSHHTWKESWRMVVKFMASFGTFACFGFAYDGGYMIIFPEEGFAEFAWLTFTSLPFLWLVRITELMSKKWFFLLTCLMLGIIFWMSLLSCVKLIPVFPFAMFPILGAMVITPYFVLLITVYEIRRLYRETSNPIIYAIVPAGALFLVMFQLVMNTWTETPWQLIQLFTLHYSLM